MSAAGVVQTSPVLGGQRGVYWALVSPLYAASIRATSLAFQLSTSHYPARWRAVGERRRGDLKGSSLATALITVLASAG